MVGQLALIGGDEFTAGCQFDEELLRASGGGEVLVVATAAAFEQPTRLVERARAHFGAFDATVESLEVYRRSDALLEEHAARVRAARFVYLTSGSPMHLRSVLFDSPVWEAMVDAWGGGAVLAASGESASALGSHMVDPRGGAFTVGLELFDHLTVIPRASEWSEEKWHRTIRLADPTVAVIGVDAATALVSDGSSWRVSGVGSVSAHLAGRSVELDQIVPVKP